jgi:uncharacterized protein YdaU (DUF1376 family)
MWPSSLRRGALTMAEFPAMNWFADAYLADTRHLSLEEHGAYRLLLDIAWRSPNRTIPDDDKRLSQMLGITRARWLRMRPTILAFWQRTDGGWTQKRLQKEWKHAQERSDKARSSANARWNAKLLKTNGSGDASAYAQPHAQPHARNMLPLTTDKNKELPNGSSRHLDDDDGLTVDEVVEAWNLTAERHGLPVVRKMTDERRKRVKARIREHSLEDFQQALRHLGESPFLLGQGRGGWKADFDFFTQKSSFLKLLEGSYAH